MRQLAIRRAVTGSKEIVRGSAKRSGKGIERKRALKRAIVKAIIRKRAEADQEARTERRAVTIRSNLHHHLMREEAIIEAGMKRAISLILKAPIDIRVQVPRHLTRIKEAGQKKLLSLTLSNPRVLGVEKVLGLILELGNFGLEICLSSSLRRRFISTSSSLVRLKRSK